METQAEYRTSTQYKDSDLISDVYQSELTGLASADRLVKFRVGDIAIEIIQEAATKGVAVSDDKIDNAIGRFFGLSGRTIRYYRETSVFFDKETRNHYDMLPFSFFVFSRTMGDRWHEVLEYAAIHPHFTLEGIKIAFLGLAVASGNSQVAASSSPNISSTDLPEDGDEMPYAVAPLERGEVSRGIPERAVKHDKLSVMNHFVSAIPEVMEIVSASSLNSTSKIAILAALRSLDRMMPQILKMLV